MEANSGLLQYYVHKLLKGRHGSPEESQSTLSKLPSRFRSKATRSYMVHEYNFLKQVSADPTERTSHSPYQEVTELVRRIDGLSLSIKKPKHNKRSSLQEDKIIQRQQSQMAEVQTIKYGEMVVASPHDLTVSAVKIASPQREQERMLKSMMTQHGVLRGDSTSELRSPQEFKRGHLRTLFGLEVRRLQLEKQKLFLQRSQKQQQIKAELLPPHRPRTPVISQESMKTKKKGFELRTIPCLKEQSLDTVFQERARRYRQFLFIIYLSCGAYRDIEPCSQKYERKKDVKYEFFVGRGNNCNLIKSIMKKRWWWTLTGEITSETKFVWTQKKVMNFIEREPITEQYCPAENKPLEDLPHIQNQAELRRLLHPKDIASYKSYVKCMRKQPHSIASRMKIFGKKPTRQLLPEPLVHNHLQYNNYIGNKKALLRNLINWYKFNKTPPNQFNIPQTFHIKSHQDKQFQQFCIAFRERDKHNKQSNVWIVKPGQNSNRGQGIKVSRNLKTLASLLQNKKHTYVVQEYLTDLFLYNRRKFDIRTYMLVTRLAGVMKVYWYSEGYIRTSSEIYQLEDLSNQMVHLTNDAIQKYGENYGRYQSGNKISYLELQKYLDINYLAKGYSVAKLVVAMKAIAQQTIYASYCRLDPNCRYSNFEIFGLDFIIDSNFKPWLLQVNTNPCLQLSSPLLIRLIPQMVENSFKIGLDPIYPPTACPYNSKPYLSDSFLDRNRFQLIFDSQFDRHHDYQTTFPAEDCNYEDDDELYENDGQLVVVED